MAIQAIRMRLVLCRRVRFAMACLTLRDNRMDSPVTKCTGEGLMFSSSLIHEITKFFVTWRAVRPRCFIGIMDYQWLMHRMAYEAILCCLTLCVWLMTHGAVGNLSVSCMAKSTGNLSVLAWMVLKFFALFRMTG
ncbi:MAG: hypothetical protein JRF43_05660 [Deltaproteobacteria bacterium]|nr:hypothetical protein [Deltaproteobacteria bacterium]